MSDIIDTESKLFKLYAARRIRTIGWANVDDIIKRDANTVNICSYTRNIGLEIGYRFMIAMLKFVSGLLLSFMILTPLLSIGFWLFTDNPFIIWFGTVGEAMMLCDIAIIAAGMMFGGWWVWDGWIKPRFNTGVSEAYKMSNMQVASTWVKAKHGKFCHRLKFDRESTNVQSNDPNHPEWPRE